MNTIRSENKFEKSEYTEIISSAIDDAIACELSHRVGADAIYAWALSCEGQYYYLPLAGLEPTEETAQLLKSQVLAGARLSLMCVEQIQATAA